MRCYVIDSLTLEQSEALASHMDALELKGSVDGIYWLPIPLAMRNDIQIEHSEKCGPYVMALEIEEYAIRLELLVRARNALHCNCVSYANESLQKHMIDYVDSLFSQLNIPI